MQGLGWGNGPWALRGCGEVVTGSGPDHQGPRWPQRGPLCREAREALEQGRARSDARSHRIPLATVRAVAGEDGNKGLSRRRGRRCKEW